MRASDEKGRHISGAEGITGAIPSVDKLVAQYTARALGHPRGEPAEVVVTVERLSKKPRLVGVLPVRTVDCSSPAKAEAAIKDILLKQGLSARAINAGLRIINSNKVMRGAAILDAATGCRLEPDKTRGVRATLMGVEPRSLPSLRRKLGRMGINTPVVLEALTLASKVASAPGIIAELCASDDPGYTTGYVASRDSGYIRIINIKKKGSMSGGRVFFLNSGTDVDILKSYLENNPVLVTLNQPRKKRGGFR